MIMGLVMVLIIANVIVDSFWWKIMKNANNVIFIADILIRYYWNYVCSFVLKIWGKNNITYDDMAQML